MLLLSVEPKSCIRVSFLCYCGGKWKRGVGEGERMGREREITIFLVVEVKGLDEKKLRP